MQSICPRCGVIYRDRTVCPLCLARMQPYAPGASVAPAPRGIPVEEDHGAPPGLVALGVGHGVVAAAGLRFLFGPVLDLYRSQALPVWATLPVVLYLSSAVAFCAFSCFGLLARRGWAEGEARRALGLLLVLFPVGTLWGVAWLAYLKRLSRPAAVVVPPPPPPPAPVAPPSAGPAEPSGGFAP